MTRPLTLITLLAALFALPLPGLASLSDEYGRSLELYRAAHYPEARAAFEAVLAHHPGDYADNIRYWIGETFYAEGDYTTALDAFRGVVTHHPGEPKAPDALFKVALCNLRLGHTEGYRNTLGRLLARYPEAPISRRAARLLRKLDKPAPATPPTAPPTPLRPPAPTPTNTVVHQLFIDDQGMGVNLPARPSAATLSAIHHYLEQERARLEEASEDEMSIGEVLLSVVAPGGLLYMAHRNSERQQAEEELKQMDQDFALVEAESRKLRERPTLIAAAP